MNNLPKILKEIDFYGQIAMVVLPIVFSFLQQNNGGSWLVPIALTVGGWQILSFIIHLTQLNKPWIAKSRRTYSVWMLAVIVATIIAVYCREFRLPYFILMIPAGLGLGCLYFTVSYNEWVGIRKDAQSPNTNWRQF